MGNKGTSTQHRPIKIFLTLALIPLAASLAFNRRLYHECTDGFVAFGVASVAIIHFRLRPKWVDAGLVVAMASLLAAVDFLLLRYPPGIMPCFSLLGLSSFAILAIRSVWEQGRKLPLIALGTISLYVMTGPFARIIHQWIVNAHPRTLDAYLLSFDGSLGVQLPFIVGQYIARHLWVYRVAWFVYMSLAMLLVMVYVGRLARFEERAYPSMLAFVLAGPIGLLFYNFFPACGPRYVFGQAYPFHPLPLTILSRLALEPTEIPGWRNAMPSLHLSWALLAWWYSKGLSWAERGVALCFLAWTVLATLGSGEHWFVDLIVAFPFALMIQGICAIHVPWKEEARRTALLLGMGGTLGWMALLRYGVALFWTSHLVPWAFSAATITVVSLRQANLESVDNPG